MPASSTASQSARDALGALTQHPPRAAVDVRLPVSAWLPAPSFRSAKARRYLGLGDTFVQSQYRPRHGT